MGGYTIGKQSEEVMDEEGEEEKRGGTTGAVSVRGTATVRRGPFIRRYLAELSSGRSRA